MNSAASAEAKGGTGQGLMAAIQLEAGAGQSQGQFQQALPRYDINPRPHYPEVARRRGLEGGRSAGSFGPAVRLCR